MVKAWLLDNDTDGDQRLPHKTDPEKPVPLQELAKIGVDYFQFEPESHENNEEYLKLKKDRGYTYEDLITVSKDTLPNYEQKIKNFFEEHIHKDEEIRYFVDGTGYFDVRNADDQWVRIELGKGDMVVLPAGIYHRFTLDQNNYCKVKRLFVGEPVWTPFNRPCDQLEERKKYVETFNAKPITV